MFLIKDPSREIYLLKGFYDFLCNNWTVCLIVAIIIGVIALIIALTQGAVLAGVLLVIGISLLPVILILLIEALNIAFFAVALIVVGIGVACSKGVTG